MLFKIGWWILPTFFTILCFTVGWLKRFPVKSYSTGYFSGVFESLGNIFIFMIALVASLLAWVSYFTIIVLSTGGLS